MSELIDPTAGGMRSYRANLGAGIGGLRVVRGQRPVPGRSEVVVRVRAVSLSYRELMILRGWYPLPVKADVVPVSDGAGEIVAVGEGVERFAVGDRVSAAVFPRWSDGRFRIEYAAQLGGSLDGLLTEYARLDESALVRIPEHLSFAEASTLPVAGVTAWNALTGGRGLQSGETVLTLGTGGVSLFAIQFAKAFGARVLATTSSEEKAAALRALGADEVLNYREESDWAARVRTLTDGLGVDHVVEVTGALGDALTAVAMGGEIALVGLLGDSDGLASLDVKQLWLAGANLRALAVGSHAQFVAMTRAISTNRIRPVIDSVFAFDDAPDAYRYYQSARPLGKVVITIG
jgi:NADPH:quinone reductase-like Zn-dependent oxidoreductase